jgi:toxin ParE1/3/4
MSPAIIFRRAALLEYERAIEWYERQRVGLGLEFEEQIERVLADIVAHPKRSPLVLRDIREAMVRRFPYCIYFRFRHGRLIVLSVFHTSRDPNVWQSRI